MRSASIALKKQKEYRTDFYCTAQITFMDGTVKTVEKRDFEISGNSILETIESSSFPVGYLVPKQITLSLMNSDDRWSEYDFYGAKIFLRTKYELDDGTIESFNIGTFTVITPESYGITVDITAMDDCYKMDKEYSTNLKYPVTLKDAVRDSCFTCGVTLLTNEFYNDNFVIMEKPTELSHRQFIGLCAMIAGGNARFDEYNRLMIMTYDFSVFEKAGLDGGIFDIVNPSIYESGDDADGGLFNPWDTGYEYDSGDFSEMNNMHVLYNFKDGIKVETDDVVITGIRLKSNTDDEKEYFFGKEGYVLSVENQLTVGQEEHAATLIGEKIVGLQFRPFVGDHIAYPLAEFMDLALIIDRKQNIYKTVITDVDFQYYGFTTLKCSADSPIRNSSKYYGNEVKAIVKARQNTEYQITEYDKAVQMLTNLITQSFGVYKTEEVLEDGSIIYYMHNKPKLEESQTIWKMTADAFAVSTDGGKTWNAGMDSSGNAVVNVLSAIGINADWINTGALRITKNGKTVFYADVDTGRVDITADSFSLSSGKTIDEIAEEKANTEVNNFVNAVYSPEISKLQAQIDGQIETWYYDYEPTLNNIPASEWRTESERVKHEGDLFYWKSKGFAYRFFKDGNTWKWQMVQDTDITKALAEAAQAQDTADSKRRVFVTTPQPPYDIGDLWTQGVNGDIMRCQVGRQAGTYVSTDWIKASKYTDDSGLNAFINGEFKDSIKDLKNQADQKAETWYQASDPSSAWTTTEIKNEHIGDIWFNSSSNVQKSYRWNGIVWVEMKSTPPPEVFDEIDGKAQIFINTPKPPYEVGDLWFNGDNSDIMTCITARSSGNFVSSDWQKRNKYIDVNTVNTQITNYDNLLNQQKIFNKLTNNGQIQGIYLQTDPDGITRLYINASYIQTGNFLADRIYGGTLTLGGFNNNNGIMRLMNENNALLIQLLFDGMNFYGGNIDNRVGRIGVNVYSDGGRELAFDITEKAIGMAWSRILNSNISELILFYRNSEDVLKLGKNLNTNGMKILFGDAARTNIYSDSFVLEAISGRHLNFLVDGKTILGIYKEKVLFHQNDSLLIDCYDNIDMHNFSIWNTSDERLKTNIEESNIDALETINEIQIYSFDWIENGKHEDLEFIAQQLETVNEDFINVNKEDGHYSVKEMKLIPYLVKAVQELSQQVSSLKQEIAELKGETSGKNKVFKSRRKEKWKPTQYTDEEKRDFAKRLNQDNRVEKEIIAKPIRFKNGKEV